MDWVADADLEDPNPAVGELFRHYDGLYFRGALAGAGFSVQWSSPPPRMISPFGSCTFGKTNNTITLSEPVLKYRSNADIKNALLHQMIHAILFVKHDRKDCSGHGSIFRAWMDAINSCSADDHQRPPNGYNITTRHDFNQDKSTRGLKGPLWKCEYCGDTLVRAMNMGAPSDACCIENVDNNSTCGNMLCHWHNHKMWCSGTYAKMGKPGQKNAQALGIKGNPTDMEMVKSQKAIQESDSDELQEKATLTEPNAEHKLLSLAGGSNVKSLESSSSKKGEKRCRPEDTQDTDVLIAVPLRTLKLSADSVSSEKHRIFSLGDRNNAKSPGGSASKDSKRHTPENVQKSSVLHASPLKKLKLEQKLVASEKNEPLSQVNYSNTKPAGSNSSNKVSKQHEPEGVPNSCACPASPPRKMKQDFGASDRNEISSLATHANDEELGSSFSKGARKRHEPADIQRSIALHAAPKSKPKRQNEISSSIKAGMQHKTKGNQKTIAPPASSQSKLKPLAPEKQKRKCKTRKSANENEKFAVISAWMNYYESEGSSGSTEPLVNKRTERAKKARNRMAYVRSRKQNTGGSCSIKSQPCEDGSSQAAFAVPCLDIVACAPPDKVVNQDPGYQSQPPAPCLEMVLFDPANQMVPLQSAYPPGLTPPNPSIASDIIDVSDDD
ncbi:hypothetical protein GUJ93_ZPchr0002g25025 [Zizania palustris]|uniref:SprT-like domain-containing protein n=1 Tax=Zizania palustris TaxID=103762 RepID=A0A8J5VEE5_ZIZPA|nr:hypothetical protein GUJ93_ZPchr0002g25025 [Zizania palustris]